MSIIKRTTDEFIALANKIHDSKYEYQGEYKGQMIPMTAICPIHGKFEIIPKYHLRGTRCKKCKNTEKLTTEIFIQKCKNIFDDKYDYTNTKYINETTYIEYICPKHGLVKQLPMNHLRYGCGKCGQEEGNKKRALTKEMFISKAKDIHNDKYDYSKVNYTNNHTEIIIICPIHGEFVQSPMKHLQGHGCPYCNQSHLEREIQIELENISIIFEYNKFYDFLEGLQLDFYIPSKKIAIECQGIQHFQARDFSGKMSDENALNEFNKIQERDNRKRELCEANGIKLLYYSNLGIEYPYEVFEDKKLLIEEINKI